MERNITPYEALQQCLDKAKTQSALAHALGCSQTAVWKMLQSSKRISPQYVLRAEEVFGVSRHDLDPVFYPRNYPPAPDARFYGVDRRSHQGL